MPISDEERLLLGDGHPEGRDSALHGEVSSACTIAERLPTMTNSPVSAVNIAAGTRSTGPCPGGEGGVR